MATAVARQNEEKVIEYVPLGANESIKLTIGIVRQYLTRPTKQGHQASDADCVKFMMLCRARELDPFTGDAFLLGYDTQDGPEFSLITAAQALFKRAERSGQLKGIQSGVIVMQKTGDAGVITQREGDFYMPSEVVVGAWARVYRKDCEIPFTDSLNLSVYTTGRSRWQKDPAGMIVKCAEASCLRKAFPSQLGGMMLRDEMEVNEMANIIEVKASKPTGVRKSAPLAITASDESVSFSEMQEQREQVPVEQPKRKQERQEQAKAIDPIFVSMFAHCKDAAQCEQTRSEALVDDPTLETATDFERAYKQRIKEVG